MSSYKLLEAWFAATETERRVFLATVKEGIPTRMMEAFFCVIPPPEYDPADVAFPSSDVEPEPFKAPSAKAHALAKVYDVAAARAELGMTINQLADAVGASPQSVRNWEHGTKPQRSYMEAIQALVRNKRLNG